METRSTARRLNRLLFALCPFYDDENPRDVSLREKLKLVVENVTPDELELHLMRILLEAVDDWTYVELEDMLSSPLVNK